MPKPSTKKKAKAVVVPTLIDAALKKRWTQLSKVVEVAGHEEASDFDRKWEAVADIVFANPPLYLAGGFSTDRDFFEKFLKVDRTTGLRKARVARYSTISDIERFGDTKIDAVLDYLEKKTGGPLKSRLPTALDAVRIPVVEDKATRQLSLAEATREQIRAATRALAKKNGAETRASPEGRALSAALAKAGLKAVDVVVHRDSFDLKRISFASLPALGRALAAVKLPAAPQ